MNPEYGRSLDSIQVWSTPEQVLKARLVDRNSKTGTFMAQYGRQHLIPPELLKKQGLHTQFLRSDGGGSDPRFFSAFEIALYHDDFRWFDFAYKLSSSMEVQEMPSHLCMESSPYSLHSKGHLDMMWTFQR